MFPRRARHARIGSETGGVRPAPEPPREDTVLAFEYFQNLGCPLQKRWPEASFRRTAKLRGMVDMFDRNREEFEQREGKSIEDVRVQMPFPLEGDPALGAVEVSVSEIRSAVDRADSDCGPICIDCPANLLREPQGCYGALNYPITAEGERWLIDRFDPPQGGDGYIPFHIREAGIDGRQIDSVRPVEGKVGRFPPILESGKSFHRNIDGIDYSSSQLLEYIFACQPEMLPVTLFGLCTDFRAISIEPGEIQMVHAMLGMMTLGGIDEIGNMNAEEWKSKFGESFEFQMTLEPGDDPGVQGLKEFFRACWSAFRNGATLTIDG